VAVTQTRRPVYNETLVFRATVAVAATLTTLATIQVDVTGTYIVTPSFVLKGSGTISGITLQVVWTDPDLAAQQTYQWVANQSLTAPGATAAAPLQLVAQGGTTIQVQAQAGTANAMVVTTTALRVRG